MTAKEEVLMQVDKINELITEKMYASLNEYGKNRFLKLLKDNSYDDVYNSLQISIKNNFVLGNDESINEVLNKIDGILYTMKLQREKPELIEINYLIKIVKNKSNLSGLYIKNIKDYLLDNYTSKDFNNLKEMFCKYGGYTPLMNQLELYYVKE